MENLPTRYTIIDQAGKKVMLKSKNALKQYQAEHGQQYKYISIGADVEIQLEVFVPRNTDTEVIATYGTVEVRDFDGPIWVEATYGGVDAAVNVAGIGELVAETDFGQIYSNLDLKFTSGTERELHTMVTAMPGTGPRCAFESKYGNIYLRKP
jgi:hypothetical protein